MSETPRARVRPTPRTIKIRPGKDYEEREMKMQEVASTAKERKGTVKSLNKTYNT